MKLAIISDTHDNLAILEKAIDWIKNNNIGKIIHCGDICSADTLQWLAKNFPGKIHFVRGNADDIQANLAKIAEENSNIVFHNELGKIKINDTKISFCHKPNFARKLAQTGKYNLIFYGHTHQPWEETISQCRLINPGNLSNMLYKASFAIYDTKTDKIKLKIMERL